MASDEGQESTSNATSGGGEAKHKEEETSWSLSYKKYGNFEQWYLEVVVSSELIEYFDIGGCYILRPLTVSIWEIMKDFFDAEIKKMKVKQCYFPFLLSEAALEWKENPNKGFAAKVAWVTRSGETDLENHIALRPTSETVMYPSFPKWIRSHRDLPLKLNQWCNVVRWEFNNPTPLIRYLFTLNLSAHLSYVLHSWINLFYFHLCDNIYQVREILELYRRIYEEYLAIPVVKGKASKLEKFPGGLYTTTVEAFIPNTGRGIQGATSHCLGQNFAKMFEINFENEMREKAMVWQNSWKQHFRTIGVMVMVHGDDKGLVLPPKVASIQVIVVPVPYEDADMQVIFDVCSATVETLSNAGVRAEKDIEEDSPSWKYSQWEMKGVPLRIEIGPKDMANNQVRVVRRDNSSETLIPMSSIVENVKLILDNIQQSLFDVAKQKRDACIKVSKTWEEFTTALNDKKMILSPWCDEEEVEIDVKALTEGESGAAKTLCTPFEEDQPEMPEGTLCFASGKPAKKWTYWGRSY
ncbi:hypothetical protein IFM89_023299 [Coptis chinensis]|uniref:proline--tRNA ligase n=1 Tax=Coptis chinensis TaxID=261450 RepID=A0A835GZE7_9MAGN|nr:hypothetical protein IFM89_023299 [Coptis chinensis]